MTEEEIKKLEALLDQRTIKLMERESELADRLEEIESQKEELTAAIEELVSKNQELLQRNHELDQLLYRTSHDLKTPVTSLEGILHLLMHESLPVQIAPYIEHIRSLNAQMNRVLASLNKMRRAVLDPLTITDASVLEITSSAIQELSDWPKYSSIKIHTSFRGNVSIKSDIDLISILLVELIANAITFRTVPSGNVWVQWQGQDGQAQLEVKDDGAGIDPELGEKIFDMFYRGSHQSIGSGMGLYIVKRLVDRLNGKIEWSSQPGLTIFRISIPV